MSEERRILDAEGVGEAVARLTRSIAGEDRPTDEVGFIGIRTRGVPLARRLASGVGEHWGREVPVGILDITLYRDDLSAHPSPVVGETELPFPVDGRRIVLVDDVLQTGRTIRSALDQIVDFGRPDRVELVVLVDRGQREMPISPDHAGLEVEAGPSEHVEVLLAEVDGEDAVRVARRST